MYFDPSTNTPDLKGEITWTDDASISLIMKDTTHFDIFCPAENRTYHFMCTKGEPDAAAWASAVAKAANTARASGTLTKEALAAFASPLHASIDRDVHGRPGPNAEVIASEPRHHANVAQVCCCASLVGDFVAMFAATRLLITGWSWS